VCAWCVCVCVCVHKRHLNHEGEEVGVGSVYVIVALVSVS
jgi:hypothetical protein